MLLGLSENEIIKGQLNNLHQLDRSFQSKYIWPFRASQVSDNN